MRNSIGSNTPRLIDTGGELSTTFDLNGHEVYHSCGVTFKNKHYIFGGYEKIMRQILEIDDCKLKSLGLIPFDHLTGACGSTNEMIFLCFSMTEIDGKRCRQAASPSGPWTPMALSLYEHRDTSVATSPGTSESRFK